MTFCELVGVIEICVLPLCAIPTTGIVARDRSAVQVENNFLMVGPDSSFSRFGICRKQAFSISAVHPYYWDKLDTRAIPPTRLRSTILTRALRSQERIVLARIC